MKVKFSIVTQDKEHNQHNIGYNANETTTLKLLKVLLAGIDPNNLTDIVIKPVIDKES